MPQPKVQIVSASGIAQDTGHASGAAFTDEDTGQLILGVRRSADSVLTGIADGDYSPLQTDDTGRLKVALSAHSTIDIGDVSIKAGDGTAITDTVSGRLDITLDSTATGHLSEIEGAVETIEGAVSGSEMQVDVVTNIHAAGNGTFTSYDQVAAPTSVATLASVTASVTDCKEIIIQVDHGNSGFVMVGSTGANAASTQRGLKLYAGDMLVLPFASTATVYLEASTSSQNINVSILK